MRLPAICVPSPAPLVPTAPGVSRTNANGLRSELVSWYGSELTISCEICVLMAEVSRSSLTASAVTVTLSCVAPSSSSRVYAHRLRSFHHDRLLHEGLETRSGHAQLIPSDADGRKAVDAGLVRERAADQPGVDGRSTKPGRSRLPLGSNR